ncbi:MAG: sensor histidine kinase [Caldilinea sp. CFX5]|nr:sensor histidine kinase [Caldilinea sp. CFX5]
MIWSALRRYWLPLTLGVLSLLLLVRVYLLDALVLVPDDIDVVVLVALLGVAIVVAIHTLVRISMDHLRLRSVRQVRQEALAEHRRFLSRLDHELKNPLTTLRTGLKTMLLTPLNEQQQQLVETMEAETLRLNRLVTDLRKLAELETEPLHVDPVNIEPFIQNIVQLERERFVASRRTFTYKTTLAQPIWVIDEDLLALAIHNLLDNAFKYTHPGDAIRLRVTTQQELLIQVADTGIGIEPGALPQVWEELYRAPLPEKITGSGIGLALVRAIVERHNGSVQIESRPGAGTTVTLRLPALTHH